MAMKILLIAPASGKWRGVGRHRVLGGKTFRFSMLSLLSVAAETPGGHEVRVVDEQIEGVPWWEPVDLVGITCMTALAPRAYEIARRYRARGVPVVLGGMHPSLCADEALGHADAVVVGDAEGGAWVRVVRDAEAGRLQGVYRNPVPPPLAGLRPVPRHLLHGDRYATVHAVQATRGCPHGCDFCAVSAFHGRGQRRRPAGEVAAEVAEIPGEFFLFVDDNLTADRDYARSLFAALQPLGKRWVTQSTLGIADDAGFVAEAARAGCIGLFVGLESFSESNLGGVGKSFNRVGGYRRAIRLLHGHGIGVEAGIVFGFDGDRPEVFEDTLRLLDDLEIDAVQVSIFTPLPGTPRHRVMSGRIFDRDWAHYDFHHVVFSPRGMTPEALKEGHDWVVREFYSPWRIARRLWRHARRPGGLRTLKYVAAINGAYLGRVLRWGIRGRNPALGARSAAGRGRVARGPSVIPQPRRAAA